MNTCDTKNQGCGIVVVNFRAALAVAKKISGEKGLIL